MALHSLDDADAPVTVTELARKLAAWEARRPAADRTGDGPEAIEVALVHTHLPKMADAGIVAYDDARQAVTLADRAEAVRTHLQTVGSD